MGIVKGGRQTFSNHRPSRVAMGESKMNRKNFVISILAAMCCIATCAVVPSTGNAQTDPRITKSMGSLKAMTAKLGAPKLEGKEAVGGKEAPALYFGKTKVNNNFDVVDAVGKKDGKGMTATLFAKSEMNIFASRPVCQSPTVAVER
jgi:hypothetical protein